MNTAKTYTLLLLIAGALCALGPWLDGQPSDIDAEQANAANLRDALAAARQQKRRALAEAAMQRASGQTAPVKCVPLPKYRNEPLACPDGAQVVALEARR